MLYEMHKKKRLQSGRKMKSKVSRNPKGTFNSPDINPIERIWATLMRTQWSLTQVKTSYENPVVADPGEDRAG